MDLVDLAEAAAADLDDQPRGRVTMELEFGDAEYALSIAVLETRSPLPAAVLDDVARGAARWYPSAGYRQLIMDAVDRQQRQHQVGQP